MRYTEENKYPFRMKNAIEILSFIIIMISIGKLPDIDSNIDRRKDNELL